MAAADGYDKEEYKKYILAIIQFNLDEIIEFEGRGFEYEREKVCKALGPDGLNVDSTITIEETPESAFEFAFIFAPKVALYRLSTDEYVEKTVSVWKHFWEKDGTVETLVNLIKKGKIDEEKAQRFLIACGDEVNKKEYERAMKEDTTSQQSWMPQTTGEPLAGKANPSDAP